MIETPEISNPSEKITLRMGGNIALLSMSLVMILLGTIFGAERAWGLINFMSEAPKIVKLSIYYGLPSVIILYESFTTTTTIDPLAKRITRLTNFLFRIPIRMKTYSFNEVRYVDFHHPQSGDLSRGQFQRREGLGDQLRNTKAFELYLFMENRDRLLLTRGRGEKRMADLGARLAKMIGTRLG